MKIESVDKHLKELLKDPVFKKEYLKDKKRLKGVIKGVIKNMKDRERKSCKHDWEQIDKRFEMSEEGFLIKILIDNCKKCGKTRER